MKDLLLTFLFLWLVVCQVTAAEVWGRSPESVLADLQTGKTGFLGTLDRSRFDEGAALGDGWAWAIGWAAQAAGLKALAVHSWETALADGSLPWARDAGLALYQCDVSSGKWNLAAERARRLMSLLPEDSEVSACLGRALAEGGQDKEFLAWSLAGNYPDSPEFCFDRVRAEARTGNLAWKGEVETLASGYTTGPAHQRLLAFLTQDPTRTRAFGPTTISLVRFRALTAAGRFQDALEVAQPFLASDRIWSSPTLVAVVADVFQVSGKFGAGVAFLGGCPNVAPTSVRFESALASGRLLTKKGDLTGADQAFLRALELAPDVPSADRVWGLRLANGGNSVPESVSRLAEEARDLGRRPEDWDRISLSWLPSLIREGRTGDLIRINAVQTVLGSAEAKARYARILARWNESGRIGHDRSSAPTVEELWSVAKVDAPLSCDGLMAAVRLDEIPDLEQVSAKALINSPPLATDQARDSLGQLIDGCLRFGLILRAADILSGETVDKAGSETKARFRRVLTELTARGCYRRAFFLAEHLFSQNGVVPDKADLQFLFPRPYLKLVQDVCRDQDLDPALVYGLMREESRFDPNARSPVGAVGLTQVLFSTARDLVGPGPIPDLTDPATNLRIGIGYLNRQIRLWGRADWALVAYNAGPGRLTEWKHSIDGLPGDLFIEALPLDETRNYVRAIVRDALIYHLLYDPTDEAMVVRQFFPSF